jgi:uncharacterized protein (DUF2164 family)
MTIELEKEVRQRLATSIRKFFEDTMDDEIGDLKATLLLDYVLQEIGPSIYNQAILDAQAHLAERVADLDAVLHHPEFGYWRR